MMWAGKLQGMIPVVAKPPGALTPKGINQPIDGRYRSKAAPLAQVFSEYGLIKNRLRVKIKRFEFLANNAQ